MAIKPNSLNPDKLMDVISMQSEIAKLGPDLFAVMNSVCKHSQKIVGADAAVVELVEEDEMVYRSASGTAAYMLGLRLKKDNSLSGLCTIEARPLYCSDSETDSRVDREACRKVNSRSMVVVPLVHDDQVVGALKVYSSTTDAFSEADIAILSISSDLIASSMYFAGKHGMDELYRQAKTDYLTGLSNRALFFDHLRIQINKSKRSNDGFSVAIIDLDNLKPINDSHGHAVGDHALKTQALRLKTLARETDTVARIGGDEFAMLFPSINCTEQLFNLTNRIEQQLGQPLNHNGDEIQLGASIGTATYPKEHTELDQLLEIADKKMYENKKNRKGNR